MRRIAIVVGAVLLTATACGGGSGSADTTSAPASTEATSTSGAVSDKQDVVGAVVRIVASGSYRDMAEGTMAADWSGTGFIISSDGLVVTNQHVVEGAGSLDVYLDGVDSPVNAKILGVSECNDLAVIDLEGDGYPYLEWYSGDVEPGLDVWVAGFPLGDPEYTLTRGSISKAEAGGNTEWASIDYVLEHDARQEPGNSGGPLVTEDGKVVGINYAGGDIGGTGVVHFYSIPAVLAEPVVETLSTGVDQDSIGVNGTAFYDDASGVAGLWVSGVRAGSPASQVGLEPGDVITDMAGRPIVTSSDFERDGFATKAGYCDIIRTQGSDRAFAISVVRFDTGEILTGEVNNPDKPLTLQQTISSELGGGSAPGYDYETVTDPEGTFSVDIPEVWSERDFTKWEFLGYQNPSIVASSDFAGYSNTWTTPGIEVIYSRDLDENAIVDVLLAIDNGIGLSTYCTPQGTKEYTNGLVAGQFLVYANCDGNDMLFFTGAFWDPVSDGLIILTAQIIDDADLQAIDQALYSLTVL